jgi:UMF1 family MFS transporter
MTSLVGLIITGLCILMIDDKQHFIMLTLVLGIFIGPAQAASRTLVARLTPPGLVAQSYGIYNLTGKAVSFLGPLSFAAATQYFGTQQAGMVTILLFWLVGLVFLYFVSENKTYEHHHEPVAQL